VLSVSKVWSPFLSAKQLTYNQPVVEPGYFRTNFLSAVTAGLNLATPIPAYDGTVAHQAASNFEKYNQNQPGNPVEGAARIWEVVRSEGLAKDKKMLLRLPLGTDSGTMMRDVSKVYAETADYYETIWKSTDF